MVESSHLDGDDVVVCWWMIEDNAQVDAEVFDGPRRREAASLYIGHDTSITFYISVAVTWKKGRRQPGRSLR